MTKKVIYEEPEFVKFDNNFVWDRFGYPYSHTFDPHEIREFCGSSRKIEEKVETKEKVLTKVAEWSDKQLKEIEIEKEKSKRLFEKSVRERQEWANSIYSKFK